MNASRTLRLAPHESIPGRPFTDPGLTAGDRAVLVTLIRDLYATGVTMPTADLGGRGRDRLILTRAGRENGEAPVTIVGFFGDRRPEAPPDVVDGVEMVNADMIAGFDAFPLLLGYVSRKLDDDFNYANLVVLAGEDGILKWRDLPEHVRAVADLAPRYYHSVRIYNGILPRGLGHREDIALQAVKYWDYTGPAEWHAIRTLDAGAASPAGEGSG